MCGVGSGSVGAGCEGGMVKCVELGVAWWVQSEREEW